MPNELDHARIKKTLFFGNEVPVYLPQKQEPTPLQQLQPTLDEVRQRLTELRKQLQLLHGGKQQ